MTEGDKQGTKGILEIQFAQYMHCVFLYCWYNVRKRDTVRPKVIYSSAQIPILKIVITIIVILKLKEQSNRKKNKESFVNFDFVDDQVCLN